MRIAVFIVLSLAMSGVFRSSPAQAQEIAAPEPDNAAGSTASRGDAATTGAPAPQQPGLIRKRHRRRSRYEAVGKHYQQFPHLAKEQKAVNVEVTLTAVNDYWSRGVSLTAGKPALQPSISFSYRSSLHGSIWASNVAPNGGANIEVDASLGFEHKLGPAEADLGVLEYIYPGVPHANYIEVNLRLDREIGKGKVTAGLAYTPAQANTGGKDNTYVSLTAEAPVAKTPLTLFGATGIENGTFGNNKIDWQIGGKCRLAGFDLSLSYADAARTFGLSHAGARMIASVARTF